ncbi:hypothetical protein AXI58_15740 [Bacillus nakamurai]|uniref:Uncharacterized protein n=1 Tax=Bacillus nakamurai TaxID=1793963 RepID=A0A150F7N4_9BACI|nr:hypothetical protein AXI58_15740 [Bacillus nakamurai]
MTRVLRTVHNKGNTVSSRLGHQMEKQRGGEMMKTIIMLGVILTFLVSIFTAGYDSKPEKE